MNKLLLSGLLLLAAVGCSKSRLMGGSPDPAPTTNTTGAEVDAIWAGDIQADTDTIHLVLNIYESSSGIIDGYLHNYGARRLDGWVGLDGCPVTGTITGKHLNLALKEGKLCSAIYGTADYVGDVMTIQITGPSDCGIVYSNIHGTLLKWHE